MRSVSAFLLLAWSTLCMAAVEEIHYPTLPAANDPNGVYILAALKLGLKKSGKPYRLVPESPMLQSRAILEAASPTGHIDLMWTMTTKEREARLLPVRIPIDKGLIGWRVPLLRTDREELLEKTASLADLRGWSAGQGHDWPDTAILQGNGLPVQTSDNYDTLFTMLLGGRFDYFPRSIMEIWNDIASRPGQPLVVDKHIVLHYPAAFYFFVSPRRPQLAKDLQAGLEKAIADGSFEALFQSHLGPFIERAKLRQRRVIELNNPLLDSSTLPLERSEMWFRP